MVKLKVSISDIESTALDAADCFRKGFEGEANTQLTALIDKLSFLLEQTDKTNDRSIEFSKNITQIFNVMMNAQQTNDTLFLADIIQYDLIRTLKTFC